MLGLFFANIISQILVTYLKNIDAKNSEFMGKLAKYIFILFIVSLTLTQLNIGKEIITYSFLIAFGAICLALALAFSLGGEEKASEILKKMNGLK